MPSRLVENSFIITILEIPDWRSALAKNTSSPPIYHSPVVVIVCMSAIRAIEVIKEECKSFHPLCKIGKLFAKHFSVEEQRTYLGENEVRVAVGTPHRLSALMADGSISLSHLKLVILDVKPDAKGRNLVESNDTSRDLSVLLHNHLLVQDVICSGAKLFFSLK